MDQPNINPVNKRYTIKEFARITQLSEVTIRKKIKNKEIQAELVLGPYGEQYEIPETEITQPTASYDVFSVGRPIPVHALVEQVAGKVLEIIDLQHQETAAEIETIKNEVSKVNSQLSAIKTLLENQEKKKFGKRAWLRNWFK